MKLPTPPPAGDTPPTPPPLMVTYDEAAAILGGKSKSVSKRHVGRLVKARKLRAVGSNQARRVVYQSIVDYITREAGYG